MKISGVNAGLFFCGVLSLSACSEREGEDTADIEDSETEADADSESPPTIPLSIEEIQELLSASGINLAEARTATAATAVDVADEIGYPVALKASGRSGRTAEAGLALDLNHADDVIEARRAVIEVVAA